MSNLKFNFSGAWNAIPFFGIDNEVDSRKNGSTFLLKRDAKNCQVGKSISITPSDSWILKVFSMGLQVGA